MKDKEENEKKVYEMYYEFSEAVRNIVSNRILALNRGEKEGLLKVAVNPPIDEITAYLRKEIMVSNVNSEVEVFLNEVIEDSYKRLIQPSVEREIRNALSEKAEEQAKEYGHTLEREVAYLTAHSMFHLMGYDHMDEDEKAIMRSKEKQVMKNLKIFKNI